MIYFIKIVFSKVVGSLHLGGKMLRLFGFLKSYLSSLDGSLHLDYFPQGDLVHLNNLRHLSNIGNSP